MRKKAKCYHYSQLYIKLCSCRTMYTFTAVGLHCLCICEGTEKQRIPENPCGMEAQEARRNPLGSQASSDPFSF